MPKNMTHRQPAPFPEFWFGAAYYPEHWSPAEREADPDWMREARFNIVRLGEFAWDLMEPQPGVFDFSFFDEQIARLAAAGVKTIFCTPTAAVPRWLLEPEMLRVEADGRVMQHGSRQHMCTTNAKFRSLSRRITRAISDHYKNNPAVVAIQTDNEFHCHFQHCFCESCQLEFQNWLRARYGSIDKLNQAWGTAFWTQTYHDFTGIELPRELAPTWHNPGAMLDQSRFYADMVARFQREQIDILRAANPAWIILHNGLMRVVDYRGQFGKDLDVLGYDTYPHFTYDASKRPVHHAFTLARTRAACGNFIVPEHQASFGGQPGYVHSTPEPGEMRCHTYRSIAHGADSLLYFRWRSCRFGAEEYWGGLIDHDNIRRRRYREAAQVGAELKKLSPALCGTEVRCDIGIAGQDLWVDEIHRIYSMGYPSPDAVAKEIFSFHYRRHQAVGLVHPEDDLSCLKLYYLPHWEWVAEKAAANLDSFVRNGGTLVIGARSGIRTCDNQIIGETFPGILTDLAGCTVEEYGKLNGDDPHSEHFLEWNGTTIQAAWHYELLKPAAAEVVARWQSRYLAGEPAVTVNRVGAGLVYYVGTYLTADIINRLPAVEPIEPDLPETVEVVERRAPGKRLLFVLNSGEQPVEIDLPGEVLVGPAERTLVPYGVKVTRL